MTEALTWLSSNPGKWVATIIVVIAILLAFWLIENVIDKRRGSRGRH